MKVLFLLVLVVGYHSISDASTFDDCDKVGEFAGLVMWLRQDGEVISEVRKVTQTPDMTRDQIKAVNRIIVDAYAEPRMLTNEHKVRKIQKYRNHWTNTCYQSLLVKGE